MLCLQRERRTTIGVEADFHQPCPCSELCPHSPPAASMPTWSAAAASSLLVGCRCLSSHHSSATTPPCTLGHAVQFHTTWAADGACPGICSVSAMDVQTESGQTWGLGTLLGTLLGMAVTGCGSSWSVSGGQNKDPHGSWPQWLCLWSKTCLFRAGSTRLRWGYMDHHRLSSMTGNFQEFLWLQKLHPICLEWSAVGHHQGPCPAGQLSETLPEHTV